MQSAKPIPAYFNVTINKNTWIKNEKSRTNAKLFLVSNIHHVLNVVCFLLGNSPASEYYMPTFRNTLSVPSSQAYEDGTVCSETLAYKNETPGNYPEESIQQMLNQTGHPGPKVMHNKMCKSMMKGQHMGPKWYIGSVYNALAWYSINLLICQYISI